VTRKDDIFSPGKHSQATLSNILNAHNDVYILYNTVYRERQSGNKTTSHLVINVLTRDIT